MTKVLFKDESYKIIGACFEVYNQMGGGFLESVYQECLEIEFSEQHIPYIPQTELIIYYKDRKLKQKYKPDFICYDKIIVEIKAVSAILNEHKAQVFNYLKATKNKLGIIVNFGEHTELKYERILL
ncbi:GxxExxY protein [Candidatus Dependentiae bacterium]|nr:GxxExxY protein [Candidatus Dependentiae bacterium]